MNSKNLREMIGFYSINKPYMVGLNKLLPIPQAENRWTDEQKAILTEVKEIEEVLENEETQISISAYINLIKQLLAGKGQKTSAKSCLTDIDERKDENQFLHVYRTYKYILSYLDNDLNETHSKTIFTNVVKDEPVPYLSGTATTFKLLDFLKYEDVQTVINENPELIDAIAVYVYNQKLKKLNEERKVLDEELISLGKKSSELDKTISGIEDEIYAINNKKEISLINRSINKFVNTKLEDAEDTTKNEKSAEDNKGKEI